MTRKKFKSQLSGLLEQAIFWLSPYTLAQLKLNLTKFSQIFIQPIFLAKSPLFGTDEVELNQIFPSLPFTNM